MIFIHRSGGLKRRGFSLVEVTASVAIMGLVVVGVILARVRAQRAFRVAKEVMVCTDLCASRVSALRVGLAGAGAGEFDSPKGYTWQILELEMNEDLPQGIRGFTVSVMPTSRVEGAEVTVWLDGEAKDGGVSQ